MLPRTVDIDQARTVRQIRLRIGRLRRRIDSRIRGSQREGRRLMSLKTYIQRFPGNAIFSAFGLGLVFSVGLSGRSLVRRYGLKLAKQGFSQFWHQIWRELGQIWEDSKSGQKTTSNSGDDHD